MGKIQTNADYIRSMSDEELAAYILNFKNTYGEEYEGESSFLEWLQEEKENSTRRLTKAYGDGTYGAADDLPCGENSYEYKGMLLKSLGKYEDAEEQGLLLRLPCKVGETVWVVTSPFNVFNDIEYDEDMKNEVYEAFVSSVTFYECGEQYRISAKVTNHFIGAYFRKCDFGKTIFFNKDEAEDRLKEMEKK
mgnify:CR=1 FL=1